MTISPPYHDLATAADPAARVPGDKARPGKHDAIIRAASDLFLSEGFDGASLDQIAQLAGVSKQTIYSHFTDKEALFAAICSELTDRLTVSMRHPKAVAAETDLETLLVRLGEETLAMLLHPASLDLHRLIVSAAGRFPDLGRAAYESGVGRMIDDLSPVLRTHSQLRDNAGIGLGEAAARRLTEQFIGMLRGFHQLRGLLGVSAVPASERAAYVRACVALLLRGLVPEHH